MLIRLPRLQLEPEPSDDLAAEPPHCESRMTIPLMPTAGGSPRFAGAADDPRHAIDHTDAPRPSASSESPPFTFRPSPWTRLHPPRWAVRGGIALVLAAVLVTAFATIRQSPEANEAATGEPPFAMTMPPPEIPGVEMPSPPAEATIARADAVPQKPRADVAVATTESPRPVDAAPASLADARPDEAKAAGAKSSATDVPAETAAASSAAAVAPQAASVPETAKRQAAGTLELEASEPLTSERYEQTVGEQTVDWRPVAWRVAE